MMECLVPLEVKTQYNSYRINNLVARKKQRTTYRNNLVYEQTFTYFNQYGRNNCK